MPRNAIASSAKSIQTISLGHSRHPFEAARCHSAQSATHPMNAPTKLKNRWFHRQTAPYLSRSIACALKQTAACNAEWT